MDELQVVCRRMIFRILLIGCSRQPADREIDARRTKLPLVVSIGIKVYGLVLFSRVVKSMSRSAVYCGIALPASFIRDPTLVSDACEDQTMLDVVQLLFILSQPSDRPDRPGDKKKPIG